MAVNACQREDMSAAQDGEEILFCSNLAGASATKADVDIPDGYTIQVEMYQNGTVAVIGTASYTTSGSTLVAGALRLYWPAESTAEYAFQATAGSTSLEEDQTTLANLRAQDKLLGSAYLTGDNENVMNYHTRKQWGQADVTNRRVPLHMKHQRSLITVILKAGVGVHREDLAHASNLKVDIFNHGSGAQTIRSYSSATTVDYTAGDEGGAASGVNTTQFQAIVEPYDYKTNSTALVANIYLSGQRFSFTAGNDQTAPNDSYNLVAGKNLVLTVTLNRGTHQETKISAQIEDWATTSPTTATIDDFGNQ